MALFSFKPFDDPAKDPLADLRALCRELFPSPAQKDSLRRIVAVGAIYTEEGLSLGDKKYLETTLRECAALGVSVDPDFEMVPVNFFDDPYTGHFHEPARDFLSPAFVCKADILMICAVFKPDFFSWSHTPARCFEPICAISPHQADDNAWRKGAARSGPSLIMTFEDGSTVTAKDFVCREYPLIHVKPEGEGCLYGQGVLVEKEFAVRLGIHTPKNVDSRKVCLYGKVTEKEYTEPDAQIEPLGLVEGWMWNALSSLVERKWFRRLCDMTLR